MIPEIKAPSLPSSVGADLGPLAGAYVVMHVATLESAARETPLLGWRRTSVSGLRGNFSGPRCYCGKLRPQLLVLQRRHLRLRYHGVRHSTMRHGAYTVREILITWFMGKAKLRCCQTRTASISNL
jgi:hypothetical protein